MTASTRDILLVLASTALLLWCALAPQSIPIYQTHLANLRRQALLEWMETRLRETRDRGDAWARWREGLRREDPFLTSLVARRRHLYSEAGEVDMALLARIIETDGEHTGSKRSRRAPGGR
jgi:hypothetical protein